MFTNNHLGDLFISERAEAFADACFDFGRRDIGKEFDKLNRSLLRSVVKDIDADAPFNKQFDSKSFQFITRDFAAKQEGDIDGDKFFADCDRFCELF